MPQLSSQSNSIQSLYVWYNQERLIVNRRYQRKLVWTINEKQRLIDSILNGYPIPAILIAERKDDDGVYEIIDGLQRLHAIVSFIETSFPTLGEKFFAVDHFPTAKGRADAGLFKAGGDKELLSQDEVSNLLDYSLAVSVMRNATDEEINDVFGRINTYGHRLSDQERRQAGVANAFSELVREVACLVRGDVSSDTLQLADMPSISIDLPMTRHGYDVKAEEVVWVEQGILRSTELRDSLDEQCVADIAACIIGGNLIDRSKDALDQIYIEGSDESERILNALRVYGADKFEQEFKFCLDEILKTCSGDGNEGKLRSILFSKTNTNSFPSIFSVIYIAYHELVVDEHKVISDYGALKKSLDRITDRLETSRRATSPEERRKNIDTVKGIISTHFVSGNAEKIIYGNHSTMDIDAVIRRSEIELSDYELKQGLLKLYDGRGQDPNIKEKVINTICAIANNGPNRAGKIIIGVTDSDADAKRVTELDGIVPRKIGSRFVVGVAREAKALGISLEEYVGIWRDTIKHSGLSSPLKEHVSSHLDFNDYFGLGVIAITVPSQKQASHVGDDMYWREADQTKKVDSVKLASQIGARF